MGCASGKQPMSPWRNTKRFLRTYRFTLLYPPCVAAIGAVKSELGARYAVAVFAFQVTVAWIVAFVVHSAGILLGLA